jgi:hypothetical protein
MLTQRQVPQSACSVLFRFNVYCASHAAYNAAYTGLHGERSDLILQSSRVGLHRVEFCRVGSDRSEFNVQTPFRSELYEQFDTSKITSLDRV